MSAFKQQSDLKFNNLKGVCTMIRQHGPISRIQLAKLSGLSATSMTRMISELTEHEIVRAVSEKNAGHGSGGRPSVMLELCAEKAYSLNLDIEGSCVRTSIMDLTHRFVVYRELIIRPRNDSFVDVAQRILDAFEEMTGFAKIDKQLVKCCGLTLGAHVDSENGIIVASSQFKWYDVNAKEILEEMLQMPVILENDCKAALYGERILLAAGGKTSNNIAYLEMGIEGVGSAVIIDGHLLRGSFNGAGEIGHMTVVPDGELCNCGRRGCFETVLTEKFVLKRARNLDIGFNTIESVAAAVGNGDKKVVPLIDELGKYIAIAINDISCAYNPEIIILNGPIIQKNVIPLHHIQQDMEKYLMHSIQPKLQVMTARMGANASLYGIGCMATDFMVEDFLRELL